MRSITNSINSCFCCANKFAYLRINNLWTIFNNPQNCIRFFRTLCRRKNFFRFCISFFNTSFQWRSCQNSLFILFTTSDFICSKLPIRNRVNTHNIISNIAISDCLYFQFMQLTKGCNLLKG